MLAIKPKNSAGLLEKAVSQARSGNKAEARALLAEACQVDETNDKIWLWRASLAETSEEAIYSLHKVLAIDPHFGRSPTTPHFGVFCGVDIGLAIKDFLEGRRQFQRPTSCDKRVVKYPECIDYAFQEGLGRLLKEAPPFSKNVHYSFGPKGDWRLLLAMTTTALKGNLQVKLGAWKALLRGRTTP